VSRGAVIVFTAHDPGAGSAPQHVAVHVSMRAWPPGDPSQWLSALVEIARPFAAWRLRSDAPLRSRLLARERELVALATRSGERTTGRWQASLFDRRAERIVQAARRALTRRLDEHEQHIAALSGADGEPALEPSLALLVS
jgi:hypothetical protein